MTKKSQPFKEIASSYKECLGKIREKCGDNYIVTDKREIETGGFLGFGKKTAYEITYTVNDYSSISGNLKKELHHPKRDIASRDDSFDKEKERLIAELLKNKTAAQENSQKDLSELTQKIESMQRQLEDLVPTQEANPTLAKLEEILEVNEFSRPYIKSILTKVKDTFSLGELENFDLVQNHVLTWIGEDIGILTQDELSHKPSVLVLVGPTGVGKTTTVAKIAAKFRLGDKQLNMRMVSIDRFRIAAQEQLAIYGEHMDIPTTAAENANDIKDLLRMDGDLDLMLIDTIGLGSYDFEAIGKMRKILDIPDLKPDVYLAVSASTKASDLRDIMDNYEIFGYKSVIITKFDETRHIGNLLSVLKERKKSVSFISSGQVVPRDFEPASVLRFLYKMTDFKIDRKTLESKFSPLPGDVIENKVERSDGGTL